MICAFIDDSSDGNTFLLAGWVAEYPEWGRFSARWTEALQQEPKIEYFRHHEAKANPPRGQFEKWTVAQIDAKMTRLVEVICEHEMYGVVVGLKLDSHWKAFKSSVLSKKQLKSILKLIDPYHHSFFAVTASVLQIERDSGNNDRRVDFVFDEQGDLFKTCAKVYGGLKTDFLAELKTIAGNVSEADDKLLPSLQAADLLAGQMVTQFRISPPEPFFQKMATCHKIFSTTAYVPNFESVPNLIISLDNSWSKEFRAVQRNRNRQ